VNSSLRHG